MLGVSLGGLLNDVAGGEVPPGLFWTILFLGVPTALGTILPLAAFVAVIWGLGRLYRDQEMAVMRASGFNWPMLLRPLFNLLLPVSLLLLLNGLYVAPFSATTTQQKIEEAFRNASQWGLRAGQFHVMRSGDLVLYVESVDRDGRTLRNVFIQQRRNDRERIWSARRGYYWLEKETGARFLTLEDGQITQEGEKDLDFAVMRFSKNDIRLPQQERHRKVESLQARRSVDLMFSHRPEEVAELQWRVSPAIATIILGLLAIPLAHSSPREGRGGRAVLGLLAYTVYINTLLMSRNWLVAGDIPVSLGMWWVHLLLLVVALIWLHRQGRMVGTA